MYRIDVPSASPTLPAPAAAGTPGFFRDGDPVAGQAGTVVPADWLNMVQEELRNVVIAGDEAPAKGSNNQLLMAILALICPEIALEPNGRVKFGFGLIVQWGTVALPASASSSVSAPLTFLSPFPTAVYAIVGNGDRGANSGWQPVTITFNGATLAGCTVAGDSTDTAQPMSNAVNVRWIAIGK